MIVSLRKANISDSDLILSWRNDPRTRKYFNDSNPIPPLKHRRWLKEFLEGQNWLFIGEAFGCLPIGVIRFDLNVECNTYIVSIYVDPDKHGNGWGTALLKAGVEFLGDASDITAMIFPKNTASVKLFKKFGFKKTGPLEFTRKRKGKK